MGILHFTRKPWYPYSAWTDSGRRGYTARRLVTVTMAVLLLGVTVLMRYNINLTSIST
jgi:hypothetical protein